MRKGIFIPDITVEMFKNASLEAVEELLVSGTMEDIEIPDRPRGEWIPCSERLPEKDGKYLVTMKGWESKKLMVTTSIFANSTKEFYPNCIAWTPLPEPYNGGEAE